MPDDDEPILGAGDGHDGAIPVREEADVAVLVAPHHTEDHAVGLRPLRRVDRRDTHMAIVRVDGQPRLPVPGEDAHVGELFAE